MILNQLVFATKKRVEARKQIITPDLIREKALTLGADTGFPFEKAIAAPGMSFICEVKKASPVKGIIEESFDYLRIAGEYEEAGAAAISVLTEPDFFLGSSEYLEKISAAVCIPTLCKDFIIDPYQIYEARLFGAGAVLLMCSVLDKDTVKAYTALAHSLGLSALVEAHTEEELGSALASGSRIIGVNNRDLRTFQINLENSLTLKKQVPSDRLFVSESGVRTREDIRLLEQAGVDAVLIGESMMKAADKKTFLKELKNA